MPRWILTDLDTSTSYDFEINPSDAGETHARSPIYSSPSGLSNEVSILAARSSARTESATGKLLSRDQYFALLGWWQKAKPVQLTDDLGQVSNILITNFEPQRERSVEVPWKHSYTFTYLVLEPTVTVDGYAGETITYPLTPYGPPTGPTQTILYEYYTGSIAYTNDLGVTWNVTSVPYDATNWYTPAIWSGLWNGSYWLIAGHKSHVTTFFGQTFAYKSFDGVTWTEFPISVGPTSSSRAWGMAWNGSYWLAVGSGFNDSGATLAKSADGETWTLINNPFDGAGHGLDGTFDMVAWNGSYWVGVGNAEQGTVLVATSPDAVTWTTHTTPMDDPTATYESYAYGVCWAPELSLWVVGGYRYNLSDPNPPYGYPDEPGIMTSPDGVNWTARVSLMDLDYGYLPTWNGAQFVLTGHGYQDSTHIPILYSADGFTWSVPTISSSAQYGNMASWDGRKWWLATSGSLQCLYSSVDGITWSTVTTGISAFDSTTGLSLVASRPNYVYPGAV